MGAIAGTKVVNTEFAGEKKVAVISFVPAAYNDSITLTLADHGISVIDAILSVRLLTGQDADLQTIYATFSGLVITLAMLNAAGANATDFTNATAQIVVIGH